MGAQAPDGRGPARILIIIDEIEFGGAERQILELAKRADKSRYALTVCCLTRVLEMLPAFEQAGVEVVVVEKRGRLDLSVIWRLAQIMRERKIDIVHTYLFTADTWGRLGAMWARVPARIASTRNVDTWKKWYHWRVDGVLNRFTTVIVSNSRMAKTYMTSVGGVPENKIRVIHNGLDLARFPASPDRGKLRSLLELPARAKIVGTVCRLVEQKNVAFFIDAAADVLARRDDAVFVVIGDGPQRAELEAKAAALGVQGSIRFLGARDDVASLVPGLDIFALTSTREGLSNAVMEAMGASLPVVVTDAGGNRELVADGESGFVVAADDRAGFVERLLRLLGDPALAAAFGKKGRDRIESSFSIDRMVEQTLSLYDECLTTTSGRGPSSSTSRTA